MKKILEFGCGREWEDWKQEKYKDYIIHCVDPSYEPLEEGNIIKYKSDIISFLQDNYEHRYDYIFANNVIEHIPHLQYQYLFYLLFLCSNPNANMVLVTADILKLTDYIKTIDPKKMSATEFSYWFTKCNYAVYADDSPHVSIITPDIIQHFIEFENLWKVDSFQYINTEDPWEVTIKCKSNKSNIDICRDKNKKSLLEV